MAPASEPSIRVVASVELALWMQVVLRQRISIALQLVTRYQLAGLTIEAAFRRFIEIAVVGGYGSGKVVSGEGQSSRLVGEQEAEGLDPFPVGLA